MRSIGGVMQRVEGKRVRSTICATRLREGNLWRRFFLRCLTTVWRSQHHGCWRSSSRPVAGFVVQHGSGTRPRTGQRGPRWRDPGYSIQPTKRRQARLISPRPTIPVALSPKPRRRRSVRRKRERRTAKAAEETAALAYAQYWWNVARPSERYWPLAPPRSPLGLLDGLSAWHRTAPKLNSGIHVQIEGVQLIGAMIEGFRLHLRNHGHTPAKNVSFGYTTEVHPIPCQPNRLAALLGSEVTARTRNIWRHKLI